VSWTSKGLKTLGQGKLNELGKVRLSGTDLYFEEN